MSASGASEKPHFDEGRVSASFKDPDGFIFTRDGEIYRQVQPSYKEHFDKAVSSGLFEELMKEGLLIPHREVPLDKALVPGAYKILKPETVPFISYPYEWCFGELREAALVTLRVQKKALSHGMVLKDGSAYNLQFRGAKAMLVDTLSLETYQPGKPWQAYRQFCQHFLAPLALMSKVDQRMGKLLLCFFEGIPLDLASPALPFHTRFGPLALHIHLQAKSQFWKSRNFQKADSDVRMSKEALLRFMDDLENAVLSLKLKPQKSQWEGYPFADVYAPEALKVKEETVAAFLSRIKPASVWDLGSHTGFFSDLAAKHAGSVLALDHDAAAVNQHFDSVAQKGIEVLPLIMDFARPSPSAGWQNSEHLSLERRGPCDTLLALAVIHHWVMTNYIPLPQLAAALSKMGKNLILEFVPKSDPQVRGMLMNRKDIFDAYTPEQFEEVFSRYFILRERVKLPSSERCLYRMEKKNQDA